MLMLIGGNRIIYPDSYPDMQAKGKTDEDLLQVLKYVHLSYLPGREGGLDTRREWKDVLSGGEKQRVSHHTPKVRRTGANHPVCPVLLSDGHGETILSLAKLWCLGRVHQCSLLRCRRSDVSTRQGLRHQ